MSTTLHPASAQTRGISGSSDIPETSFTIDAPSDNAAFATSDLTVSIEIAVSLQRERMARIAGSTRLSSSRADTGCAPGRGDSPPTSMTSAPSDIMRSAWAIADSVEKKLPPSLKLSGVTLRIPKIVGRWDFDGQAKLTRALPPGLRREEAWTALDASPELRAPEPSAVGSPDAEAASRRARGPRLRRRSAFRDRAAQRQRCAAARGFAEGPLSREHTLP